MVSPVLPTAAPAARDRALDVLLSRDLRSIVDLVCWRTAPDRYEVASADGHLRFQRTWSTGSAPELTREVVAGYDFLANQDPAWLGTLPAERRDPHPTRLDNAYPHAYDHLAQIFDHPSAPDLVVLHTGSHFWGEQGGHLGEHGSLGVLQARAPFIAAGAGVARLGTVDGSCRLVDVAPTILEVLGAPAVDGDPDRRLRRQDGSIVHRAIEQAGGADHVVAFLLDGTNPNVLYDLAANGGAPNIARLMEMGTTLRHGAIASLPTVTLANHTGILTGLHPGHHGVLHNAWVDRVTGQQVVTNSPTTWLTSMQWLADGVETIHHAMHRAHPGALSVSINEPCDSGADYSVFELIRRGEEVDRPPPADNLPDATQRFVRPSKDYRWSSKIDHTGVDQFCGIWSGRFRGREWDVPAFTWVNFTLTDAAFHEGGPYSEIAAASVRDTDARIGRILEAVEQRGTFDRTAFFLVADHGMQLADEAVTGDWDIALADAGVAVRDEGYGFLYLPPE